MKLVALILSMILSMMLSGMAGGQVASSVRLGAAGGAGSALYAKVGGVERKIAEGARKAWLIDGGRQVLYSAADGAGGYEQEGQGLHVYAFASGKERKIMAEYFVIERVEELKTKAGGIALLVTMRDGGLGATHVAVVNLERGEVFSADGARFLEHRDGRVVVGTFRDEDWERLRAGAKVRPQTVKSYDVDRLMGMPVIENKAAG